MIVATEPVDSNALLKEVGALQSGHFLLSSGRHSDTYVQCARLTEWPKALESVAQALLPIVRDWNATVVVSPALGALLFGHELARALGTRHIFAERPDGQFELRRGFELSENDRVIMAENVITTGGSVNEVATVVRSTGAKIVGFTSIIDRSAGAFSPSEPFAVYAAVAATSAPADECPWCRQGLPLVKPGSRQLSK